MSGSSTHSFEGFSEVELRNLPATEVAQGADSQSHVTPTESDRQVVQDVTAIGNSQSGSTGLEDTIHPYPQ